MRSGWRLTTCLGRFPSPAPGLEWSAELENGTQAGRRRNSSGKKRPDHRIAADGSSTPAATPWNGPARSRAPGADARDGRGHLAGRAATMNGQRRNTGRKARTRAVAVAAMCSIIAAFRASETARSWERRARLGGRSDRPMGGPGHVIGTTGQADDRAGQGSGRMRPTDRHAGPTQVIGADKGPICADNRPLSSGDGPERSAHPFDRAGHLLARAGSAL